MSTQKRTPATAMTGALDSQADRLSARAKPKNAIKQELLDRLDVLEVLSDWRVELQIKLARANVVFLFSDADHDFGPLAQEVRDFTRVSKLLRLVRGRRP